MQVNSYSSLFLKPRLLNRPQRLTSRLYKNDSQANPDRFSVTKRGLAYFGKDVADKLGNLFYKNAIFNQTPKGLEITPQEFALKGQQWISQLFRPLTSSNQHIQLVMPGFPFKSPSPLKTISEQPDMAENIAIQHLRDLLQQANQMYKPGIELLIFSDGLFFAPIKGVPDQQAINYSNKIRDLIKSHDASQYIKIHSLDELYGEDGYEEKRQQIIERYGRPIEQIRQNVVNGGLLTTKFDGIHRFYQEEMRGQYPHLSNNQRRKQGKLRAYQVIQAAELMNNWLADLYPNAIRASVHPQPLEGNRKIGIGLTDSLQSITPWHAAAVQKRDGSYLLLKVEDAVKWNLPLQRSNGTSQYYVPEGVPDPVIPEAYQRSVAPGLVG